MEVLSVLRNIPLFESLQEVHLKRFEEKGYVRTYPRKTLVLSEGDESGSLFVVLEGSVKIYLGDQEGREIILGIEGVGGYFGEIALLDCGPRSASVMTTTRSTLLMISRSVFESCICEHPEIALDIFNMLTKRVRTLTENVRNLALNNVYGRVVAALTRLVDMDDKGLVLSEKVSHKDIADMCGSSREMVSRVLKDLETGGYVTMTGRRITINRPLPSNW